MHTLGCLKTLKGHRDRVMCVFVYIDKIVSGSKDTTVKLWDLHTNDCLETFRGHNVGVKSVFVFNDMIVSGSPSAVV